MAQAPDYALVTWFDTYVRPQLGGEKTIERLAERLFSVNADYVFGALATPHGELALVNEQVERKVAAIVADAVLKWGRPVANRYYGREVSEDELENLRLEKGLPLKMKEDEDGSLGVG